MHMIAAWSGYQWFYKMRLTNEIQKKLRDLIYHEMGLY